jgi:hypothetical protein
MKQMSQRTKTELLQHWRPRYRRSGRPRKQHILDEFCALTGSSRKHAIKLLNGQAGRRQNPPGRKPIYTAEVVEPLKQIWLWTDQLCSKLLQAALPEWIGFYEQRFGPLDHSVRRRLLQISPAQIDRLLAPHRVKTERWRRRTPTPGTLIRSQVPIRTGPWNIDTPGYLEVDSVAHCGGSMAGDFLWSITYTDILSSWTSLRASWNCSRHAILEQTRDMEACLPFELLGFDSDNGGEFLNDHLYTHLTGRPKPVRFTRSRPYRKNDNAHVEQKNYTHVRQLLGYDRLEDPNLVKPINDLYRDLWEPFHNFFRPCVKLVSKERIGSRYRKRYDRPRTPYQRLIDSGSLSDEQAQQLAQRKEQLDPFELKSRIEDRLAALHETRAAA